MILYFRTLNLRGYRYLVFIALTLIAVVITINSSTSVLKLFYPVRYSEHVCKYARMYNIDPYLVFAIIKAESSFDPMARSSKNARGLMQISEKTAFWGAESTKMDDFDSQSLYDTETNIKLGCWYIGMLMRQFDNDVILVMAAYNGGSGRVTEWLKDSSFSDTGKFLDRIPFKETKNYVKRVNDFFATYKSLYEQPF